MSKNATRIFLDKDLRNEVFRTGESVNNVLEDMYSNELAELRKESRHQGKSATQIALFDNGIRGNMQVKNLFTTEDNKYLFSPYIADLIDTTMSESDIMSYIVSGETGIDSTVVEVPKLNMLSAENKKNLEKVRVAEGSEFPVRTITIGSDTARLFKKGIRLEQTYEAARRMNIDLFSKMVSAISTDIVRQNVKEASNVLLKSNMTEIATTKTANIVTNDELLDYIFTYVDTYGFVPTTIIAGGDLYKSLYKMVYNVQNVYGLSQQLKLNFPQVKMEDLNIIKADLPQVSSKNQAIMFNKNYSLQRYVENGSTLTEYDKAIQNQTQDVVISEVSGYANMVDSVGRIKSA